MVGTQIRKIVEQGFSSKATVKTLKWPNSFVKRKGGQRGLVHHVVGGH